ncbi:MAG: DEAD/DEAH box helicase family protein [Clostridia bacterium]|nr:DEAD/DEAH box helicase family protein [Clostridia bacterium]
MPSERKLDLIKDLNVSMSLRKPQQEALSVFAEILDLLKWEKVPWVAQAERNPQKEEERVYSPEQITEIDRQHPIALAAQLDCVREKFLTVTSFEREFPSICFALATGVGKTRLMAAIMAYLHRVKKVNNFFVVAPNRTIYEKLKRDFSQQYPEKYVFSGLYDFVAQPYLIDGDNFNSFNPSQLRMTSSEISNINIHIFNIAKLTHGRGVEAEMARVMRLHEVLGQSYFNFLRSLPDLCVMMDESHHYHAEQGFGVINDLNPMIGVEFTATPQIQTGRGKVDFKNVVYEYSLAHALKDKMYVKEPVVWTRRDFDSSQYTDDQLDREKLIDGIKLHIDTKAKLDVYARNYGKPFVKPFVLVVAKDIAHSKQIRDLLTSAEFYDGYYADKVLEINSKQGKVESDENTELLLSLESPDNRIEIVIHVDKLKEGWDVKNLYTIVPLRASASETLTEQTIGRGLRLPYGERTGVDEVDHLSIVSHDKFKAIVDLANDPNSLVRKIYYIDPSLIPDVGSAETEPVEIKPTYEVQVSSESFTHEISSIFSNDLPEETRTGVASFVAEKAALYVVDMSRRVSSFTDVRTDTQTREIITKQIVREVQTHFPEVEINKEEIRKAAESAIEYCVEALTGTIIPIPELVINPQSVSVYRFDDFDLNTRNMNLRPADDTIIGRELSEGGRLIEFEGDDIELLRKPADSPENEVAKYIIVKDNIDYTKCGKLIFSLIAQAKKHFLSYLNAEDTEKVMRQQARTIADFIYAQMNEHFHESDVAYSATEIRPFSRIEGSFGSKIKADDIYAYTVTVRAGEVRQKVFKGFTKACHTLYKFDSLPELEFARVLEQDGDVLKWLRPAPRQFNIYWGKQRQNYEPDFIVETAERIYMCEVKAFNEIATPEVQEKGRAGSEYCRTVSEWNANNGGKPWEYAIVADRSIQANSSFRYLIDTRSPLEILLDEQ